MKHSNSSKEITINSDLKKAIYDISAKNLDIDQDKMIDMIVTEKKLRLTKENIKSGVEAYFNSRTVASKQQEEKARSMIDLDMYEQKPVKKTKKNEFIIEFQDNESYNFKNLGGIEEVYNKVKSELFSLIEKE